MAAMFYSLEEVLEKLKKTKEQIDELIKQGRLREFRDGPSLLFKVDEVESLLSDTTVVSFEPESNGEPEQKDETNFELEGSAELEAESTGKISFEPEEDVEAEAEPADEINIEAEEPAEPEAQPADEINIEAEEDAETEAQPADEINIEAEDEPLELMPVEEAPAAPSSDIDIDIFDDDTGGPIVGDAAESTDDIAESPDEIATGPEDTVPLPQIKPDDAMLDDIMGDTQFAPEETDTPTEGDTSSDVNLDDIMAETQAAASGDFLLDEGSETNTEVSEEAVLADDDVMGDTKAAEGTTGLEKLMEESQAAAEEMSLEEIEDDVNLDSFGSGSGLLDLSLQADDTSLGGILDEIYTPEGEEQMTSAVDSELGASPEPDDILEEQGLVEAAPAAMAAYVEPAPDSFTNAVGISLFLPLLAIVYTAIIVLAAASKFAPSILGPVKAVTWPVFGGLIVLALIIVGAAAMTSASSGKPKVKKIKPKKEKKKEPKPKKEKKKKEKKPKKKKEKKPKK